MQGIEGTIVTYRKAKVKKKRVIVERKKITSMSEINGLLTVNDVADILRLVPQTIREYSNKGLLKVVRINARGDRRYRKEDIESFLEAKPVLTHDS